MTLRAKSAANAQPYLQPGEQVQVVIGAQTANQWWILLSAFIVVSTNKYRMIVTTDRLILVLGGGHWSATNMKEVVAEVPRHVVIGPASGLGWKCVAGQQDVREQAVPPGRPGRRPVAVPVLTAQPGSGGRSQATGVR